MSGERMRATVVFEYSVDPDRYPGATTASERAEIDRKAFLQDREALSASISVEALKSVTVTPMSFGFREEG